MLEVIRQFLASELRASVFGTELIMKKPHTGLILEDRSLPFLFQLMSDFAGICHCLLQNYKILLPFFKRCHFFIPSIPSTNIRIFNSRAEKSRNQCHILLSHVWACIQLIIIELINMDCFGVWRGTWKSFR